MAEEPLHAKELRAEILSLLARAVPFEDRDEEGEETPDAGVPTAVLVVVEWQASDGQRWLSRMGMLGNGQEAPRWTSRMLAREVIDWDQWN
jgi:hypothetical protein